MNDSEKNVFDSLDEMLESLTQGSSIDQSIREFENTIKEATGYTTYGTKSVRTTRTTTTSTSSTQKSTYSTVKPHVDRNIESQRFASRYDHVLTCLENIIYSRYPDDKKEGYMSCIERFIAEIKDHQNNLKPVELQVEDDMKTYKEKTRYANADAFLVGYYDALLMVKKLLYNSKLSSLQLLVNRVGR